MLHEFADLPIYCQSICWLHILKLHLGHLFNPIFCQHPHTWVAHTLSSLEVVHSKFMNWLTTSWFVSKSSITMVQWSCKIWVPCSGGHLQWIVGLHTYSEIMYSQFRSKLQHISVHVGGPYMFSKICIDNVIMLLIYLKLITLRPI